MSEERGWIGVDLDGTWAVYDGWKGIHHIGKPIQKVTDYILELLAAGIPVRIFTARCQEGQVAIDAINAWCLENHGFILPVTDRKDFAMVGMLDDRATTVEKNTGKFLTPPPSVESILYHYSPSNPDNPAYVAEAQ